MTRQIKTVVIGLMAVGTLVSTTGTARAQYGPYYGGYAGPVRTMPLARPVPSGPYAGPYYPRPTLPSPPRGVRVPGSNGPYYPVPSTPGGIGRGRPLPPPMPSIPSCRGTRSNGACYGGSRPGVW